MATRAKKKGSFAQPELAFQAASKSIASEVPSDRSEEIKRYLQLFGYKPQTTILQVHIAGFFRKKSKPTDLAKAKKMAYAKRYGGTTFVIVGRTHDPSIMNLVIRPKRVADASPGYVGYLWKAKNIESKAPHELIPLDFTPSAMHYPEEWKLRFGATKGFMVAMHVPASFAPRKNGLLRALSKEIKSSDPKSSWEFLPRLAHLGFEQDRPVTLNSSEETRAALRHALTD